MFVVHTTAYGIAGKEHRLNNIFPSPFIFETTELPSPCPFKCDFSSIRYGHAYVERFGQEHKYTA